MARTLKATLALTLLLAPSFVFSMDVKSELEELAKIAPGRAKALAEQNANLVDVINGHNEEKKNLQDFLKRKDDEAKKAEDLKIQQTKEKALATYKNITNADLANADALTLAEIAQATKVALAKSNADARAALWKDCTLGGTRQTLFGHVRNDDGTLSTKHAVIDLVVVATAVAAAYFGTDTGNSAGRWILSYAPDAIVSEERKAKWAVEKEQKLAKQREQAAARASNVAQLKAQHEELAARREAAVNA
jgi:DNA polymerase III psi subunit